MNNTKAIIDFSNYTAPELGPVAQIIHDKLTDNAATFTTPPVTMTALQTLITTYDGALVDKASGAKADTIAFNEAREDLEDALGNLGNYINTVAKGDPAKVEKSGFPSYVTAKTADTSPPAKPQDLSLKLPPDDPSGTVKVRFKADRSPSTNELQITTGDPSVESGWQTHGIYQGSRITLTGLTPGTLIWVRVRTVGLKGVMGAWSDPAQIRVV